MFSRGFAANWEDHLARDETESNHEGGTPPKQEPSLAEIFYAKFSPFRSKYTKYTEDKGWRTIKRRLTDGLIANAIKGSIVIGFFLTTVTTVFGLDIDDHQDRGKEYLVGVYRTVVNKLPAPPSLVVQSPRGLHLFYFLSEPRPFTILQPEIRRRVGSDAEVKPTPKTTLRIPCEDAFLDPISLHPIEGGFGAIVHSAAVYQPTELFGLAISHDANPPISIC